MENDHGLDSGLQEMVREMIEADAAKYAKENKITPRDCS